MCVCVCFEVLEGHKGTGGAQQQRGPTASVSERPWEPARPPYRWPRRNTECRFEASELVLPSQPCTTHGLVVLRRDVKEPKTDGGEERSSE